MPNCRLFVKCANCMSTKQLWKEVLSSTTNGMLGTSRILKKHEAFQGYPFGQGELLSIFVQFLLLYNNSIQTEIISNIMSHSIHIL